MGAKVSGRRRRPTQERARATREHILATASTLIGERGIADTSTNRIAAEAGVSVGTVYRYFADRAVLVEELLERLLERIERRFTEQVFGDVNRTPYVLFNNILQAISDELVVHAPLIRAVVGSVQFYSSGVPEFEPRLHLLVKVALIQILGPGDDRRYDAMAVVIINTGFAAVMRASAGDIAAHDRARTIDMTARMIGAWIESETNDVHYLPG